MCCKTIWQQCACKPNSAHSYFRYPNVVALVTYFDRRSQYCTFDWYQIKPLSLDLVSSLKLRTNPLQMNSSS